MRPDIHLLHSEACTNLILSYIKRFLQKVGIDFQFRREIIKNIFNQLAEITFAEFFVPNLKSA
jgi:hypothetical protein